MLHIEDASLEAGAGEDPHICFLILSCLGLGQLHPRTRPSLGRDSAAANGCEDLDFVVRVCAEIQKKYFCPPLG